MTNEEEIALKAACVQAAATLKAAQHMRAGQPTDVAECAKLAAELYASVTAMEWELGKRAKVDRPAPNTLLR